EVQNLQERRQPSVDAYGDPLPPGAVARLGTLRLRHTHLITASAVASDGSVIATGGQDGTVCLWEIATGRKLRQLLGMQSEVGALIFSSDGKDISGAERGGGALRTWETATGKELRRIPGYQGD